MRKPERLAALVRPARRRLAAKFAQPGLDRGVLFCGHLSKHHAHAKNTHAISRVHVDHFARNFARVDSVADAQSQLGSDGNRLERIDIAAAHAQLRDLGGNGSSIAQGRFGIREEGEAWIGTPYRVSCFGHDFRSIHSSCPCWVYCMKPERASKAVYALELPKAVTGLSYRRRAGDSSRGRCESLEARTTASAEANERAQPSTAESKSGDPSLPA